MGEHPCHFGELQIEKARSAIDIQPRRPPFIECQDPRLKAALIVIENHVENTISIAKVAGLVGLSRRQLERLFRDKTKFSPATVYKRVRLERAKQLLMQTRTPLIEIAIEDIRRRG